MVGRPNFQKPELNSSHSFNDWPVIPDHSVERPIDQGSFGRVWLCKSFTGRWRAAKIVSRAQFKDPSVFDRELSGIQRVEDLSRQHPNLNQILHVGSSEPGKSFYCILELADDFPNQPIKAAQSYQPATLFNLISTAGALPVAICYSIFQDILAGADFLHSHGLVHRDLKPSNIIFIHRIPQISDFGLVATTADTHFNAGTAGYVPPEGPGKTAGDIFALGRILYQMIWGVPKFEFPSLPPYAAALPDVSARLSLNALADHACDPNPADRIQSAAEFREALQQIQIPNMTAASIFMPLTNPRHSNAPLTHSDSPRDTPREATRRIPNPPLHSFAAPFRASNAQNSSRLPLHALGFDRDIPLPPTSP